MSLFGQASGNTLKGKINRLAELRGYSAYEIALIHGYSGTEEEWLESLVGGGAISFNGRTGYVLPQTGDYTAAMVGADKAGTAAAVSAALTQQINANAQNINANAQNINANAQQIGTKQAKISTTAISLTADWTGEESPYSQTVTVPDMTAAKKVDLQLTPAQINALMENGTAGLQAVNNNGTVTVYAFGEKPTEAMTIQATLTEVV